MQKKMYLEKKIKERFKANLVEVRKLSTHYLKRDQRITKRQTLFCAQVNSLSNNKKKKKREILQNTVCNEIKIVRERQRRDRGKEFDQNLGFWILSLRLFDVCCRIMMVRCFPYCCGKDRTFFLWAIGIGVRIEPQFHHNSWTQS